jgi:HlyD family secretion protein
MKQSSGYLGTAFKFLIVIVLIAVLGAIGYGVWGYYNTTTHAVSFRTEKAFKGPLVATVSSTGTIEPEDVIDIGAQIAGQVIRFGPDLESTRKALDLGAVIGGPAARASVEVDLPRMAQMTAKLNAQVPTPSYSVVGSRSGRTALDSHNANKFVDWCTNVEAGDVLAQLDDSLYRARVKEAEADLESAKADLEAKTASYEQAEREWKRAIALKPSNGISDVDYRQAEAVYYLTKSAVSVSKAAIGLKQAQLNEANVNLGYTIIKSPVKGVVIDRRVNVGQTVVAGLSAPSLFLLAKDLKRVQVWVSVNEADVGAIREAMADLSGNGVDADFTVDAIPGKVFHGKVTKVRLNAVMTQNVVTYTVEVTTDNPVTKKYPDGVLIPYLTANVKFIIEKKEQAHLVPNSALRWRPPAGGIAQVHPDFRQAYEASLRRKSTSEDGGKPSNGDADRNPNQGTVWVEKDGFARPVKVITGKTDNINTEIVGLAPDEKDPSILDFDAGSPLIVGEAQGGPSGTVNPFAPKMFGGGKKQQ